MLLQGLRSGSGRHGSFKGVNAGKRNISWLQRHARSIIYTILLVGFLCGLDSLLYSVLDGKMLHKSTITDQEAGTEQRVVEGKEGIKMYGRLLNLAMKSLSETEYEGHASKFLQDFNPQASMWRPCADKKTKSKGKSKNSSGFIVVSANGGLNQQRVAICNAVAVASLLNATLVIPRFLYSNVWNDPSQFSDIYQEDYFINMLKNDVPIVKELPSRFNLKDLEAIGSLVTDADIPKEATPRDYITKVLPILLQNGVVHFLGFGNRLGFDPMPIELQSLRCKCNFHALKFVPRIQKIASLLLSRIRGNGTKRSMLEEQLLGNFTSPSSTASLQESHTSQGPAQYLALHLRFEIDMVAYSMCEFGGGEVERRELQAYREAHFPLSVKRLKDNSQHLSPTDLRQTGKCPMTPEETALLLSALRFKRNTYIYLAGSHIYGGESRMLPLTTLYPNLVTKEDLLSPKELAPLKNFSSQLAAVDFIMCATADIFAITDSGSQLSSLVSGFRTYYGNGRAPSLRPNHKKLAEILLQNRTMGWKKFEDKIKRMVDEGQKVRLRGHGQSLYRLPRSKGCMCKHH